MRPFVEECLLSPDSATGKYFDQRYIRQLLDLDRSGREQFAGTFISSSRSSFGIAFHRQTRDRRESLDHIATGTRKSLEEVRSVDPRAHAAHLVRDYRHRSASFDGCDRMLHEHFPQARFVQSRTNLGFAGRTIAHSAFHKGNRSVLNPDTELVGPAIETLMPPRNHCRMPWVIGAPVECRTGRCSRAVSVDSAHSQPASRFLVAARAVAKIPVVGDGALCRSRWPTAPSWKRSPERA